MTPDQTHAEVLRLSENEALAIILSEMDKEARDGLVQTPAEQADRIRDYQAAARAVEAIRQRIKLMLATTAPKAKPGTV